jgi:excinuclease UvrABC ATPase subunit
MKLQLILLLLIICSACNKKTEEQTLLYKKLINYRDDLKMSVKSKEIYLSETTRDNEFYRKRFDSLNRINRELEKSFERLRNGDRKALLELRDNYNEKYKLNAKFDSSKDYENVVDSIFNRLIETDILKLRQEFQNRYMFLHGDKFE